MRRLVLHAGMHKTGSSSIQATFGGLKSSELSYMPYVAANHSGLLAYLTHPNPESFHGFSNHGLKRKVVNENVQNWGVKFSEFLKDFQGTGLFSAEYLSSATKDQVFKLSEFTKFANLKVNVIIYIRPPVSYMQSAFQQRLKGGAVTELTANNLWPNYRSRVEPLDDAFGSENVTVKPFHPWEFPEKNVVLDFADYMNVKIDRSDIKHKNESLSAEAIALLYLQRLFGQGLEKPAPNNPARNLRWVKQLNNIGSQKLTFSNDIVDPIIHSNKEDLEWIEKRMGCKLEDRRSDEGYEISSAEDLIKLGMQQRDKVETMLRDRIDQMENPPRKKLVQLLEALRALS